MPPADSTSAHATGAALGGGLPPALTALSFQLLWVLPSLAMVSLGQSSMAAGLIVYSVAVVCLWLLAVQKGMSPLQGAPLLIGSLLAAVAVHGLVAYASSGDFEFARFASSYASLGVVLVAAWAFASFVAGAGQRRLEAWVQVALGVLALNALAGLLGLRPFEHATGKPAGYFSEPSHLALALAPLLLYLTAVQGAYCRVWLVAFMLWGVAIQSLTTLTVVALCGSVLVGGSTRRWFAFAAAAVAVLVYIEDVRYFSDRMNLFDETANISALALRQGWEHAGTMLVDSALWGVGFQQFGNVDLLTDSAIGIMRIGVDPLNRRDGGSSAAKLTGEFGLIGIMAIAGWCWLAVRDFVALRHAATRGLRGPEAFFAACRLAFIMELFVRGVGYFSPGAFLILAALIHRYGRRDGVAPRSLPYRPRRPAVPNRRSR